VRQRLPIVLSITALVVALLGTGAVQGVAQTVVDYARNSDRVDGIHAARTPRANRLLALDANARFPRSVFPRRAPGSGFAAGPVSVATGMSELAGVDLQTGHYVIVAKAWFRNDGTSAAVVQCRLRAGTEYDETNLRIQPGGSANARSLAAPFALVHRFTTSGRASLRCRDFGGRVQAFDARVVALDAGA
jgi:hypothetical protein